MFLYKISQDVNDDWDTYDSAVVAAENEEDARNMHPATVEEVWKNRAKTDNLWEYVLTEDMWAHPAEVDVEYLGKAHSGIKAGVICASFNAG